MATGHLLTLGTLAALALFAVLCTHAAAADEIIAKREIDESDLPSEPKRKRPFCNAFTGCGRKRSDDSLNTLVEPAGEPAVADLNRQILAEAKMWEALQEARAELQQRRLQHQVRNPAALLERGELMPLAASYRKRRDVHQQQQQPPVHKQESAMPRRR